MRRRHHLPTAWLFTDERMGARLLPAVAALPPGSGIVFRHYDTPDRDALAGRIAAIARRRRLTLVIAGDAQLAKTLGAAGTHLPSRGAPLSGVLTAAAHGRAGIVRARRSGAALVFLSPVFETASHPQSKRQSHRSTRPLGPVRFGLLARGAGLPVAALGGMTARRFRRLRALGAAGWGAIDAFTKDQKLIEPPR